MNIFEIFNVILWPIKWAVEFILVFFHQIFSWLGMPPAGGFTWVLSIIFLVLVIRAMLIPVFLKQIRAQRKMIELGPEAKKIQAKYKGKKDMLSRQAMTREMTEMYRKNKSSPFSSCLPMLFQMPIFIGLYQVLENAQKGHSGVGPLTEQLGQEFGNSKIFGSISIHDSFVNNVNLINSGEPFNLWTMIIAAFLTLFMTAIQFINQLQITSKNIPEATKQTSIYKQQRIMLFVMPAFFLFLGYGFAIGLLVYWSTSNIWSAVQQGIVVYRNPTPGSTAHKAKMERMKKRNLENPVEEEVVKPKNQRQQPISKKRGKKNR